MIHLYSHFTVAAAADEKVGVNMKKMSQRLGIPPSETSIIVLHHAAKVHIIVYHS